MADFLPHPLDGHSEPRAEWPEAEVEKAARALYEHNNTPPFAPRWTDLRESPHGPPYTSRSKQEWRDDARAVLEASGAVPRAEADRLQRDADRVDRAQYHVERANTAQVLLTEKAAEVAKLSVAYVKSEEQLESAESQLAALRARCEGVAKEIREAIDSGSVDLNDLYALADRLGGPDDAPKEPTHE